MRPSVSSRGFLAIEIILAITTIAIVALAVGGLFAQGQTATVSANERTVATLLAKEGLEAVRSIRDEEGLFNVTAWDENDMAIPYELERVGTQWQLIDDGETLINDRYRRTIYMDEGDTLETRSVYSVVRWDEDRANPKTVGLVTYITNWQVESIPEDIIP